MSVFQLLVCPSLVCTLGFRLDGVTLRKLHDCPKVGVEDAGNSAILCVVTRLNMTEPDFRALVCHHVAGLRERISNLDPCSRPGAPRVKMQASCHLFRNSPHSATLRPHPMINSKPLPQPKLEHHIANGGLCKQEHDLGNSWS